MAKRLFDESNRSFRDVEQASGYLHLIVAPASFRWTYCRNGKTASTSTLELLFALEFGVPLSAWIDPALTLNPDALAHYAIQADVLRPVDACADGVSRMQDALRLMTVRHPLSRAISGFRYLCLSGAKGSEQFLGERIRLNADVGFDWAKDPLTSGGFIKFLTYIAHTVSSKVQFPETTHWRPQTENTRPAVYDPAIIGRVEDFAAFADALGERLGGYPPGFDTLSYANRQPAFDAGVLLDDPAALPLVGEVFASDFAAFGYDLAGTPGAGRLAPG